MKKVINRSLVLSALVCLPLCGCLAPANRFSGNVGGVPFTGSFPQDVNIGSMAITVPTSNGPASLTLTNFSASNKTNAVSSAGGIVQIVGGFLPPIVSSAIGAVK